MSFLTFLRANSPFLSAGALLALTSSYGQTYFISLFAGEIRAEFGLSHGAWGGIYTAGTTISAIVMVWAGALTDRFRVRHLGAIVAVVLALACLLMAGAQNAAMLILAVFALRFAGQGMMSHLSVVAMARWFVATRGRALSIAAMGYSVGQAILPILFVALLVHFDWQLLWVLAAGLVLLTMPVLARLLRAERTPQSVAEETQAVGMEGRHWTRRDVLHHWLFWLMVPVLLGPPAWGTALFFQQVHLTEVKGWALVDYVALMPLFTAVAVGATFAAGALIDRFGSAVLAMLYMIPYVISFCLMAAAENAVRCGPQSGCLCAGRWYSGDGTGGALGRVFWHQTYRIGESAFGLADGFRFCHWSGNQRCANRLGPEFPAADVGLCRLFRRCRGCDFIWASASAKTSAISV